MASYAEHVSDNLQHASELLEIDRKVSQDKFLLQENILATKQKEIEEIIIANKRNEANILPLSRSRDYDNKNNSINDMNNNYDNSIYNNEIRASQNTKNWKTQTASQKISPQNIPQKSNPNKSSSGARQNETETKVVKEVESYGGSVISDGGDDYDDYSIAFDLDNSRISANDRNEVKNIRGGKDMDRDKTDKSSRRTSFNASISSDGLPSFYQNQNQNQNQGLLSASTSQKNKNLGSSFQREVPADSDYSEIFESVEYDNEIENEKEVDEVEESTYRSVDSTYSNLKNSNNNSISQSISFDDKLKGNNKKESEKMKNISTSFNKDQNNHQNKPNLKATVVSSMNNSSVTYSTDSYHSTDDPNISLSHGAHSVEKKKRKEGNENSYSSGNVMSSPNWSRNIPQARSLSPQDAVFLLRNRRKHGSPGRFQAGPRSPTRDRRVAG